MSRMILLTEGMSNLEEAKTATGLLRYRGEEVAAVFDSACVGETAQDVFGVGGGYPGDGNRHRRRRAARRLA